MTEATQTTETTEEFYLGQIFDGIYPPEAAYWCNDGGIYHIEELSEDPETGEAVGPDKERRLFKIVENVAITLTPEEEAALQQEQEAALAEFRTKNNQQLAVMRSLNLQDSTVAFLESSLPYWDIDIDYESNDYVKFDNAIYKALTYHTSNVDRSPDVDTIDWQILKEI